MEYTNLITDEQQQSLDKLLQTGVIEEWSKTHDNKILIVPMKNTGAIRIIIDQAEHREKFNTNTNDLREGTYNIVEEEQETEMRQMRQTDREKNSNQSYIRRNEANDPDCLTFENNKKLEITENMLKQEVLDMRNDEASYKGKENTPDNGHALIKGTTKAEIHEIESEEISTLVENKKGKLREKLRQEDIIYIKPEEKQKFSRTDTILLNITAMDALARGWQERIYQTFPYSLPYEAMLSHYLRLFSNNAILRFNKIEKQRSPGDIHYKEEQTTANRPKFAFFVYKHIQQESEIENTLPEEFKKVLIEGAKQDTNDNMYSWWKEAWENIKKGLLRKYPMTKRLIIPMEVLMDFDDSLWSQLILDIYEMRDYFVDLKILIADLDKTKREMNEKRRKGEILNIEDNSFPVIKINGDVNGVKIQALIDTGASTSCMNVKDLKRANIQLTPSNITLRAANNTPLRAAGAAIVPFRTSTGHTLHIHTQVVEDEALHGRLIVGLDYLKKKQAQINCATLNIELPQERIILQGIKETKPTIRYVKVKARRIAAKSTRLIEIPPETTNYILIKPKGGKLLGNYIFKPNEHWEEFIPEVFLEFDDNLAHIPVYNKYRNILRINKYSVLGTLEQCDTTKYDYVTASPSVVRDYNYILSDKCQEHIRAIRMGKQEGKEDTAEEIDPNQQCRAIRIANELETEKGSSDNYKSQENCGTRGNKTVSTICNVTNHYDELTDIICAETAPGSTHRILLLVRHYRNLQAEQAQRDTRLVAINSISRKEYIKEEQLSTLTDIELENFLEELDVKHMPEEDRKTCVFELLRRNKEEIKDPHLIEVIKRNYKCIALNDVDLGEFDDIHMAINYFGPVLSAPIATVPIKYQDKLQTELDRLLKAGVIRESNSFYNSNILIVPKKNTEAIRIVLDSRAINMGVRKVTTIMPRITELLFSLGEATVWSSLDLLSAYWSIPLCEESRHLTGFSTHRGRYEFQKCVMGLAASSSVFQKCLRLVLEGLIDVPDVEGEARIRYYMDDLIIIGFTKEESIRKIDQVMNRFVKYKLKLKLKKCEFLKHEITFLGHTLNKDGIKPIANNIIKVNDFPIPKTVREVQSFLGVANYYRNYIPKIAEICAPLYSLLRKDIKDFHWTDEADEAFKLIKSKLVGGAKLFHPNFEQPFLVATDSSDKTLAGVLSQKDEKGVEKPLLFLSRTLTKSERNWPISHKEMAAIVFTLSTIRNLILGYDIHVTCDHYGLLNMFAATLASQRMLRMAIKISEFSPRLYFIVGKENIPADYLSRCFIDADFTSDETTLFNITAQPRKVINKEVEEDIWCAELINRMGDNTEIKAGRKKYTLENGQIYMSIDGEDNKRKVVPTILTQELMKEIHEQHTHPGVTEMLRILKKEYYWLNMGKEVANFVAKCIKCQTLKPGKIKPPPLVQFAGSNAPFQTVSMDLVGPLYDEQGDKKYVLTLICRLTRFAEVAILQNKSAEAVSQGIVESLLSRHSMPSVILSDNGKEFTGQVTRNLMKTYGVRQSFSPSFCPQSNGLVEALNKSIIINVRLLSKNYQDWVKFLHMAVHAYNTAIHSSIGRSPFTSLYFRDPYKTYSTLAAEAEKTEDYDTNPYGGKYFFITKQIFNDLETTLKQNDQLRNDKVNNKKIADVFTPGDLVYMKHIHTTETNVKLQARFTGPYRLIEMIAENMFYVESLTTGKLYRTHARRVKMAHPETLQEGEHPNLNRTYPTFIDLLDEGDGLSPIEPAKMITEVMTSEDKMSEPQMVPEAKWEMTYTKFNITHPIWDKPNILHVTPIDALELSPKGWLIDLFRKYPFLNVYAKRVKYANTKYARNIPNPVMGTIYHEQGRYTRRFQQESNWILVMCTMTHRIDKTNELLCSNILDDEYKKMLSTQTPSNVIYWLQKGLREIPNKVKGKFTNIVLHIPCNTFPITQKDKSKVEGQLKGLSEIYGGNPVINYINY